LHVKFKNVSDMFSPKCT